MSFMDMVGQAAGRIERPHKALAARSGVRRRDVSD
jgi:hypothetical protein